MSPKPVSIDTSVFFRPRPFDTAIAPEMFMPLQFKVSHFLHENLVPFVMDIALLRKMTNTFEHSDIKVEAL